MPSRDVAPTFWALCVEGKKEAVGRVGKGSILVLTSASCTHGSAQLYARSPPWATESFLLGSLSASAQSHMELQQPFVEDVAFEGRGSGTIHLVGYLRKPLATDEPDHPQEEEEEGDERELSGEEGELSGEEGEGEEPDSEEGEEEGEESSEGGESSLLDEDAVSCEVQEGSEEEEDEEESSREVVTSQQLHSAAAGAVKRATAAADEPPAKKTATAAGTQPVTPAEGAQAAKAASLAATREPAAFTPSKKFLGARAGCVFKLGTKGLGYYKDAPPKPRPDFRALPGTGGGAAAPSGWKRLEAGLEAEELGGGSGVVASKGSRVRVKYVGKLTSGRQFDAGSISFKLGAGEVIRGWDRGIAGMRVGQRRRLRIAPQLAYGPRGAPPDIPPNATLLFDVELLGLGGGGKGGRGGRNGRRY